MRRLNMGPGKDADLVPEAALEPAGAYLAEESDSVPHAELEPRLPDGKI